MIPNITPNSEIITRVKRIAKDIGKQIIPASARLAVQGYLYKQRYGSKDERNLKLKDRHLGKRAFVIGNGPSILKQDLTRLSGEVTFVMNSFFYHSQYAEINPTYLCSCDPLLIDIKYRKRWYEIQAEKTRNTIKLFSKSAESADTKYGFFANHQAYYLYTKVPFLPPLSSLEYCPTDLTAPLSGHGLVFIDIALLAAFYMGIKEIYILGFDGGEINCLSDYINYNFYGADPLFSLERYTEDYQYFCTNQNFQKSRAGLYEKSAACIKRTFARQNVKIMNATLGGMEMDFERVSFEDLVM